MKLADCAAAVDALWRTIGGDAEPTRVEAERAIRKLYRFGTGTRFDGQIKFMRQGTGTWQQSHSGVGAQDPEFYINLKQGWQRMVHIVASNVATIFYRDNDWTTRLSNRGIVNLARIELSMVREVIKRGWMGGTLADTVVKHTPEQAREERHKLKVKRLNARVKAWQTKQKRATTALRKLCKQLKAMEKRRCGK